MKVTRVLICFFIVASLFTLPVTSYTQDLYRRRPPHHGCAECAHSCPERWTCHNEDCNCVPHTYCDDVNLFCDQMPCGENQVGTCLSHKCTCVDKSYCNDCHAACRGHPFTCSPPNYNCHCHNPAHCSDTVSGPTCLSSDCGGTRKCVDSRCKCEYHCGGAADCRNYPCLYGSPECVEKQCACHDPCHKCETECHDKYTCVEGHHHHVSCTCHNNAYCDHNVHCIDTCPYGGKNLCLGNTCTCHCTSDSECTGCPEIGICFQNQCRCQATTTRATTTTTTTTTTTKPTTTAATTTTTTTPPKTTTTNDVSCKTTDDCMSSNYTVNWNPFEFVLCEDPAWRTCSAGYCVCNIPSTTVGVELDTTTAASVSSNGVNCPTCDDVGTCTWSNCPETEVCMLRTSSGKLNTHCSIKADCVLIQGLLTTENVQCCEDPACVNQYLAG